MKVASSLKRRALDLPKIRFDAFIRRLLLSRSEDGNEQKEGRLPHAMEKEEKAAFDRQMICDKGLSCYLLGLYGK